MRLIPQHALYGQGSKLGISRATLYRLLKDPAFPRPVTLMPGGRPQYVESEIDDYLQRVAQRRVDPAAATKSDERAA